jgi:hypothetical protein
MKRVSPALLIGFLASACTGPTPHEASFDPPTPSLRVRPDPIAVVDTFVGCAQSVPVEITNADPERPLTLAQVSSSNPAFRLRGARGLTLAPGETRTLRARFTPVRAGRVEGEFDLRTDEFAQPRYRVSLAAVGIEAPPGPLDLVFVLDVSTSMNEIAMLRGAIETLFDAIEAEDRDVRIGLTTFENDVVVHRRGVFLDRAALFQELDPQLESGSWIPDSSLPRQLLNFELEENLLDALYRSATEFDFRPEARRYVFVMTDDTFLEPPAVFSDGNRAMHSYSEVASALTERDIGVFSVHLSAKGRGLSSDYEGQRSLIDQTGGAWDEISAVGPGSLERMLGEMLTRPDCHQRSPTRHARKPDGESPSTANRRY